ncbi:MAG: sulfurtransferase TusA family protein [Candidatus Eisenbacteria bacterium]
MITVDARGLSCPEPVLRTRRAISTLPSGEQLEVLVETVTSRENVLRAARSMGCTVSIEEHPDGYRMIIRKGSTGPAT